MSNETQKTLEAALEEFGGQIEEDAAERGIDGKFHSEKRRYMFAYETPVQPELPVVATVKQAAINVGAKSTEIDSSISVKEELVEPVESPVELTPEDTIRELIAQQDDGTMKQSEIKKALIRMGSSLEFEQLQDLINQLEETGKLFKFKRNGVAYLSFKAREDESLSNAKKPESTPEKELNMHVAADILQIFTAPGTHVDKSLNMNQLWRAIHAKQGKVHKIPDEEIQELKSVCRQLEKLDIMHVASTRNGTGGPKTNSASSQKRVRSAKFEVLKARIINQQTKKEIQEAIEQSMLWEYLAARKSQ